MSDDSNDEEDRTMVVQAYVSDVMTAAEVACVLRVSSDTVYRWARAGRLPHKRVRTSVAGAKKHRYTIRFSRKEIEEWWAENGNDIANDDTEGGKS